MCALRVSEEQLFRQSEVENLKWVWDSNFLLHKGHIYPVVGDYRGWYYWCIIIGVYWCILMLLLMYIDVTIDVYWCILMYIDVYWCYYWCILMYIGDYHYAWWEILLTKQYFIEWHFGLADEVCANMIKLPVLQNAWEVPGDVCFNCCDALLYG